MIVSELLNLIGFGVDKNSMNKAEKDVKAFQFRLLKVGKIVGASILAIGIAAVKTAADMEMLEVQFEVMLGSAEAAAALMEKLKTFAAATPFALKDLAQGTQTLLAAGIEAENVVGVMRMLGDAAQGNNEKLQSMALVYGRIQQKGKASLEEINMLVERQVPIIKTLTNQLGLDTPEALFKLISAGKVTSKDMTAAFQTMTSEGGVFFKGMEKQGQTFLGLLSTMKDNITFVLADIGKKLLPTMKILTKRVTTLFQGVLGELAMQLTSILNPVLISAIDIFEGLLNVLLPITKVLIDVLVPVLDLLFKTLLDILKPALQFINAILAPILNIISAITPIFLEFATLLLETFTIEILKILTDMTDIFTELGVIVESLLPAFIPLLQMALKFFGIWLKIRLLMHTVLIRIMLKAIKLILGLLSPLIQKIAGELPAAVLVLAKAFKFLEILAGKTFAAIKEGLSDAFASGSVKAKEIFQNAFQGAKEFFSNVIDVINVVITAIVDRLMIIKQTIRDFLVGIFGEAFIKKVSDAFRSITDFLANVVESIFARIFKQINNVLVAINKAIKFINDLPFVKESFKELELLEASGIFDKLKGDDEKTNQILAELSGLTTPGAGDTKITNLNLNNDINITNHNKNTTTNKISQKSLADTTKNIFSIELKRLLVDAGA